MFIHSFRDFAYVARDRLTRIHMCHVFRCDTAARVIANTLRDICKRIMIERSLQLEGSSSGLSLSSNLDRSGGAARPTDLPTENRRWVRHRKKLTSPGDLKDQQMKICFVYSSIISNANGGAEEGVEGTVLGRS